MAKVILASALARWLPAGSLDASGESSMDVPSATVGNALEAVFDRHPNLRGYVVDELGNLRHHVAIFVDGAALPRRQAMDHAIGAATEVHVLQALSGG
jgi:molybdopterin synthase sulfur carrier subunit